MVSQLFVIGIGGFLGAVLRFGISGLVSNWSRDFPFPWPTLAVNLLGCLLIGGLSQLAETHGVFSAETRSFVFIGFLGAFTTYSTFSNETVDLIRGGQNHLSLLYVGLHLVLGIGAVWLGRLISLKLVQ